MGNVAYITREGLDKLRKDLDQLLNIERPAISRLIADARDKGDLSENAEYAAAKEAQGMLEMKISQLETIVAHSRIIEGTNLDTSEVRLLNKIKIRNRDNNAIMEYIIVHESEADLKNGKIGINTPVAQGLLG